MELPIFWLVVHIHWTIRLNRLLQQSFVFVFYSTKNVLISSTSVPFHPVYVTLWIWLVIFKRNEWIGPATGRKKADHSEILSTQLWNICTKHNLKCFDMKINFSCCVLCASWCVCVVFGFGKPCMHVLAYHRYVACRASDNLVSYRLLSYGENMR